MAFPHLILLQLVTKDCDDDEEECHEDKEEAEDDVVFMLPSLHLFNKNFFNVFSIFLVKSLAKLTDVIVKLNRLMISRLD